MIVLGIDPGTATTGYGLVRDGVNGPELVAYGVITTPKTLAMGERLREIYIQLRELLREHRPETAAVEKLFFQRNVSTAMTVGQARGVILLALTEAGVSIGEYTPNEVKHAVAGYGSADKQQMQQMVRTLLNLREIPRPDDAADALAVAICHLHSYKYKNLS